MADTDDTEVCPVCRKPFVSTTDAPVQLNSVGGKTCLTSFGLVVYHGPDVDDLSEED